MRFTTTSDGVRLAYTEIGEGPPLVFTWGMQSSHNQLAWRIPSLKRDTLRISEAGRTFWFDWRNTGLSGSTDEEFTLEAAVRDIEAIVELAGSPVALWTGANAAKPAFAYTAAHPDKVTRLAIYCGAIKAATRKAPPGYELWFDLVDQDPVLAVRLLARTAISWDHDSLAGWEQLYTQCAPLAYQRFIVKETPTWDVSDCIPHVRCPVLVVQGAEVPYPTVEESAELVSRLADAHLLVIPGASYGLTGAGADVIPTIVDFCRRGFGKRADSIVPSFPAAAALSAREREVLVLIAGGNSNKQVAAALSVSVSTVNRHIANLYAKIGAHNRADATLWAVQEGLVVARTSIP
jgi:DNA-binding CsgD family transcriptional regulator/pimeloyl-ACP methyl ester carboxylesterase